MFNYKILKFNQQIVFRYPVDSAIEASLILNALWNASKVPLPQNHWNYLPSTPAAHMYHKQSYEMKMHKICSWIMSYRMVRRSWLGSYLDSACIIEMSEIKYFGIFYTYKNLECFFLHVMYSLPIHFTTFSFNEKTCARTNLQIKFRNPPHKSFKNTPLPLGDDNYVQKVEFGRWYKWI